MTTGDTYTSCSNCGAAILPATAAKTGGVCRVCERRANDPNYKKPVPKRTAVTERQLAAVLGSREAAIGLLFNSAHDLLTDAAIKQRREKVLSGDIAVYNICTFHGELLNGGFGQYFFNDVDGLQLAHYCPQSLILIGAGKYANLVTAAILSFTKATSASDSQWETDLESYLEVCDDPFSEQQEQFFAYHFANRDELIDLLYQTIKSRPYYFAAMHGRDG